MRFFLLFSTVLVLIIACAKNQTEYPIFTEIAALHKSGNFSRAEQIINDFLKANPGLNDEMKKQLAFEVERGRRIQNDYRLTRERLVERLKDNLENFNEEEFTTWQDEGRFDYLTINGENRFANPSYSNLFFRYPELKSRLKNRSVTSQQAQLTYQQARVLKDLAENTPDPVVLPRYCRVIQTLRIKPEKVPAGELIRCWLPYPSVFSTQGGVQFISSDPPVKWIASPDSPIRSVYFEATAGNEGNADFTVEYLYTAYAYYREIDTGKVESFSGNEPEYLTYTREEVPHEIFTPVMRRLAETIVGDEENPYLKGKKIYNWISDSIKYSYAREYSTLRNISQYCLENKYGDCGQEAILFITLCRIAGVPARWQSGFMTFPGSGTGMHDWAEVYIKPYGWIPADPYMGIFFTSVTDDLTADQRREMRDFYYGNIDHYRLVANKGHNQILVPEKRHFRSETVDFQRGEVEWNGGNLYFTDWRWHLEVKELDRGPTNLAQLQK